MGSLPQTRQILFPLFEVRTPQTCPEDSLCARHLNNLRRGEKWRRCIDMNWQKRSLKQNKTNKQKTLHRLNKIWTCLNRATLKYLYWKFKFYPAFYLRFILFNYTILFVMCLNDFKERYFALGSFILLLWLCIKLEDHRSKYNWKLGYREKEKIFSSLGILNIVF